MELNCEGYLASMLLIISDGERKEENPQSKVYCASI